MSKKTGQQTTSNLPLPTSLDPVIVLKRLPGKTSDSSTSHDRPTIDENPSNSTGIAAHTDSSVDIIEHNPTSDNDNIENDDQLNNADVDDTADDLSDDVSQHSDTVEHQSSSDSDDMANRTGLPPPPVFTGDTAVQCPQEWVRSLRYWVAFKEFSPEQTKAAIPVLLRDSALVFYQGLAAGQKDTIDHFEEHFLKHVKTAGTSHGLILQPSGHINNLAHSLWSNI